MTDEMPAMTLETGPGDEDMAKITHDGNLRRIKRLSRILKWVVVVFAVLVPLSIGLNWTFGGQKELAIMLHLGGMEFELTMLKRLVSGLIVFGVVLIASYSFLQLHKLFGLFQNGEFFTARAIIRLTRFGRGIFFFGVARTLSMIVIPPLMTYDRPEGAIWIVGTSLSDVLIMITGGAVWLASWVMLEGKHLSEEMQGVI